MNDWKETMDIVLEQCKGMHLWYSIDEGWCYITDPRGQRHRIDSSMKGWEVFQELERVKQRIKMISQ
jgi:hypothetical protein